MRFTSSVLLLAATGLAAQVAGASIGSHAHEVARGLEDPVAVREINHSRRQLRRRQNRFGGGNRSGGNNGGQNANNAAKTAGANNAANTAGANNAANTAGTNTAAKTSGNTGNTGGNTGNKGNTGNTGGNNGGANPTCLAANAVQTGSAATGQTNDVAAAGQVNSAT